MYQLCQPGGQTANMNTVWRQWRHHIVVQATGVLLTCRLDKLDKHKRQMGFVPQNDIMYR